MNNFAARDRFANNSEKEFEQFQVGESNLHRRTSVVAIRSGY